MTQQPHALISFDGDDGIPLAQGEDVVDLKRRIEVAAVETRFVDFSTANGTQLSVLVSPYRRVSIAVIAPREPPDPTLLVDLSHLPPDLMDF
ncbi:hypothetical protein ACTJJ4_03830 [Microbacterium sp. 22195]|uniref:hypothetical protein n=1 Tax=Microbacterium sp. 22195 TaxID=3453891 RepID=UPI003F8483E9